MPTILLVDDDELLRATVEDWLALAGFSVIAVPDTLSALREIESRPVIDLCLVDLVMPSEAPDGAAFVRSVRDLRPELPVIMMTGFFAAAAQLGDLKAVSVLYKPFQMPELIAEIKRQLS
jgi:DNA-binding NtrC family response regulator